MPCGSIVHQGLTANTKDLGLSIGSSLGEVAKKPSFVVTYRK